MRHIIYIHIGVPKTGTSAIQKFMWKNRVSLKKLGVLYPESDIVGSAHYKHAWVFFHRNSLHIKNKNLSLHTVYENLFREIKSENCEKVILSCEDFVFCSPSVVYNQFKEFYKEADIKIIVYIRRQDLLAESAFKQNVKDLRITCDTTPKCSSVLHEHFRLRSWISVFGKDNLILRIYDRSFLPQGNVIIDFLNLIGVDHKLFNTNVFENPSLSVVSVYALKNLKLKYEIPPNIFKDLLDYLLSSDEGYSSVVSIFSLEERKRILEYYAEENEFIFETFFNSENRFVLSKEEIEFYEEQDKLRKEVLPRMVEERYRELESVFFKLIPSPKKAKLHTDPGALASLKIFKDLKGVFGWVERVDEKGISGWLLDTYVNQPAEFVIKINGLEVFSDKTKYERKDVKEFSGKDINAGFLVSWSDVEVPDKILRLPYEEDLEIEVVHKRTGWILPILPSNYKKLKRGTVKFKNSTNFPYVRHVLDERAKEFIEFMNLDQLFIDVLKGGRLILGGLVVIKKEFNQSEFKLIVKDAEREKEVQWFLPSPGYAQTHPDNPNAKNARYRVEGVVIEPNTSAGLFLMKGEDSFKLLEISL